MHERFRSLLPHRDRITSNPWLRWLAPYFGHPKLWHWSRRGVALGVAIGVFFGLLIPIAQIPLAAGTAVILRANLPAAAASTLVTNPVTFAPVYYFAYRLGTWVTGGPKTPTNPDTPPKTQTSGDEGLWQRIAILGMPLIVGLAITASLAGLLSYGLISLIWYWHIRIKHRRRAESRRGRST